MSLRLLKEEMLSYVEKVKEERDLAIDQKVLFIWDTFRGQDLRLVTDALD